MPGDETIAILNYFEHILFQRLLAFSLIVARQIVISTNSIFGEAKTTE